MHTPTQRRWYLMLDSHGHRPGACPMRLLEGLLECSRRDPSMLDRLLDETRELVLREADGQEAELLGSSELVVALESWVLVYAARLFTGEIPAETLKDAYLGARVRRLGVELWRPSLKSPAARSSEYLADACQREILQLIADLDAGHWPDQRVCRRIAEALAAYPGSLPENSQTWRRRAISLLHALADEGIVAVQLRYMCAAIKRAHRQVVMGGGGIVGAIDNFSDDVIRPLTRIHTPRHRASRAPLSRARKNLLLSVMDERLHASWDATQLQRLTELSSLRGRGSARALASGRGSFVPLSYEARG